eukprot:492062_1
MMSLYIFVWICFHGIFGAVPEPSKYILDFPTEDNPLNISVASDPSKNYIILIGDWGCSNRNPAEVQTQTGVANKMKSFYNKQKEAGYNLLFVATVGDNFYEAGQDCTMWKDRFTDMYGEIATDYYWLAVFGNHDWGGNDTNAMCAWGAPNNSIWFDPKTNIPYGANQINKNKGGCNPNNYYLPDFGYYYTINELNFELIAMEETASICPNDMGGRNIYNQSAWDDCHHSNGQSAQDVGCGYLGKMRDASEKMMVERANKSQNTNFLLNQHYPGRSHALLEKFTDSRGSKAKDEIIWSIFGHTHTQKCNGNDNNGHCNEIMSGGGGAGGGGSACNLKGFYVIGFDENKNMIQPYKFDDPLISCEYPSGCGVHLTDEEIVQSEFNLCCYGEQVNVEGTDCHLYDLSKC